MERKNIMDVEDANGKFIAAGPDSHIDMLAIIATEKKAMSESQRKQQCPVIDLKCWFISFPSFR